MAPPQRAEHPLAVGPIAARLPDARRLVVLRGGGLGDLLMAMPAIESLAHAYPDAELVIIGAPAHAALLSCRPGPVDTVLPLPDAAGTDEPGEQAQRRLMDRARPVDLAVQLHGGGAWSNPFIQRLAPRLSIGARSPDATALDRTVPYRAQQHDVSRGLEIAGLAGALPTALRPRITVTDYDLSEADTALRGLPRPILAVHPGARDPRRRWPVGRFAETAARAADAGAGIVIVGSSGEHDLVGELAGECRRRLPPGSRDAVRPLAGALSMAGLTGVLARSAALLACDSGPRHLAEAIGTPTVSVYWAGNLINAGPAGRDRHRVHVSWTTRCPVCDVDCTDPSAGRCEHDVSFVDSVPVDGVLADVMDVLPRKTNEEGDDHAGLGQPAEYAASFAQEGAGNLGQGP